MRLYVDPIACMQCGFAELDGLEMDHINDDGAHHRRTEQLSSRGTGFNGGRIYELVRKRGKIEGLQVLCANCNRIKQLRRWRKLTIKDPELLAEIEAIARGIDNPK